MQDHLDEATFDAHDDFVQCGAQDPLAGFRRRGRVRPSELQIGTELHQVPPLFLPQRCRPFRLELSNLVLSALAPGGGYQSSWGTLLLVLGG
jgi:hypothetical protein